MCATFNKQHYAKYRCSNRDVFLGKVAMKICSKFTGKHPCRSPISIKLQSNFIEITLRHGCILPLTFLIMQENGFDKKANVICKIYLINWETNNCNTHSAQYVKK